MDTILVTGGAAFFGSNFAHHCLAQKSTPVVNLDKLTYAGNSNNLSAPHDDRRHVFVKCDIGNGKLGVEAAIGLPTAVRNNFRR